MELNPGLSEVVFGLRAEVEALKTRLNKIERCLLYTSDAADE